MQANRGLAEGTVTVYARSLDNYLAACGGAGINPLQANQGDVARWVHQLDGLSNATLQLRLVAVRLFYDYLVEEGIRRRNPVGRGRRPIKVRQSAGCSRSCTSSPGYRA